MGETRARAFDLAGTAAVLLTLLFWSGGPIFIEYMTGYIDVWTQNFLRYIAACVFWLPLLAYNMRKGRVGGLVWKKAVGPGIANIVMQTCWAGAFYYLEPAFAVLLIKTSVIWIALFSFILFAGERPLLRSVHFQLGLVLSVVGVAGFILKKEDLGNRVTGTGIAIILLCGFMWAVYTVYIKRAFRDIDKRMGFAVVSVYMVGGLGVLAFVFGRPAESLAMPVWGWVSAVVSGVTAIGLGHVLYYVSIHRLGATIPGLILLSQPFTVFAISHFAFGETLNGSQVVFGCMLLAGSALAIWAQKYVVAESPR